MWKRYKYMILSFFFVVGIFVVGVKLPDFVSATGTDKTDLIYDKKMEFSQVSSQISISKFHLKKLHLLYLLMV